MKTPKSLKIALIFVAIPAAAFIAYVVWVGINMGGMHG